MKKLFALLTLASLLLAHGVYAENTTNGAGQPGTTVSQPSAPISQPGVPVNQPSYPVEQGQSYTGAPQGEFEGSFHGGYAQEGDYQGGFAQEGSFHGGFAQEGGYPEGVSPEGITHEGVSYEGGYQDAHYQDNTCCQNNGSVDMATGDCYCKRVCYKTCYCKVPRCEYVTKCYQRRHCRWVCQEYQKPCVKYVPVCTTETRKRYVPEYYYTTETRQCPVWRCDIVEKQVPRYYYQHVCQPEAGVEASAPATQECCP